MECHKIETYRENGLSKFRSKKKFETQEEAITAAKKINSQDYQIHKVVPYRCSICFKFHIGKGNTILTNKEKEKYKRSIES